MIYITGDTHGEFSRLDSFDYEVGDTLIILGDAGINFASNRKELKSYLNNLGLIFFCVRGNHEERPENISSYHETLMYGGSVFVESEYPNLIFAKDGEVYNIDGYSVLVMGGACSVDKEFRVKYNYPWYKDEQLSHDEMVNIYKKVCGKHFDVILTHTCPYKYEPSEVFKKSIDEFKVDRSMECFLI